MTPRIHPTAIIHPDAKLDDTVEVGPYAIVGAQVQVGARTRIGAHAILDGCTEIGTDNQIFPGAVIGQEPQDLKYQGDQTFVKIGNHNQIREYVTINRATGANEVTQLGNNNLLMAYVHVGHNCFIEDEVIIANGDALSGHVTIETRARLSGVLGVHQFVHIGRLALVGGMSRITRDIPPSMLVEGNPARVRSLNQVGLQRAGISDLAEGSVLRTLKKAFRLLYRSNLPFETALEQLSWLPNSEHLQHLQYFLQQAQAPQRRGLTPGRSKPT